MNAARLAITVTAAMVAVVGITLLVAVVVALSDSAQGSCGDRGWRSVLVRGAAMGHAIEMG